jgi:Fe-Mn family superoxide dismutase
MTYSPDLPFEEDALEPALSAATVHAHFLGYHCTPAKHLVELVRGSEYQDVSLEKLIDAPVPRTIRTPATQIWNHRFLWNTLRPPQGGPLPSDIQELLVNRFGGLREFQREFHERAHKIVGSGWLWLVLDPSGCATILLLGNAANPLSFGYQPLLGCDLWEHAYYLDYNDDRDAYLAAWWKLVNWNFVNERLKTCRHPDVPLSLS